MVFCFCSPHTIIIIIIIISLVLVIIPHHSSASITFNFENIYDHQSEIRLGNNNSYVSPIGLQLTPNEFETERTNSGGRATYITSLHLWDNTTREAARFSTNFTFIIDSTGNYPVGDGLTFFLAANNSDIGVGSAMGLPVDPVSINATAPFVALEFDTYANRDWDPYNSTNTSTGDHVGINVNSLRSVRFMRWFGNISAGSENQAWVDYNPASQNLSVRFTVYRNNRMEIQTGLSYIIDLRQVLPEWVIFGVSAATGTYYQRNTVRSWGFTSSTLRVNEEQMTRARKNNVGLVAGVSATLAVFIIVSILLGFNMWRKKREEKKREELGIDKFMDNEFESGSGPKKFKYRELTRATNNFAEDDKLGQGGFGGVYKGLLRDSNTYIAVKRVSSSSRQGIKEYASEVSIISRVRHRNLVQLIGWCHEHRELLLVYEYMENGSLDSHLFNNKSLLTWKVRSKIAQGIASALLYLHEEWEQCVVHRDIKSSNVMLDTSFNAKLGDFGLARLVDHEKGGQTTVVAGTMGYMAPEYMETGKASKESDVFSFGVVALEIACGRKPINYKVADESEVRLVEWVWNLYGSGKILDAADQKMDHVDNEDEIERLMVVGLWCAHPDWKLRPTIRQTIQFLKDESPSPKLPSKMPVATYFSPSVCGQQVESQVNTLTYTYSHSEMEPRT